MAFLHPASEEEGAPKAQIKDRPTATAAFRLTTSYAEVAEAANSGAHTLSSLAPELISRVRQSPCTHGKHTHVICDATDFPHDGTKPEDLLPWPCGLSAAASARAMLAKASKPVVCWLVVLCATLNCLSLGKQFYKLPDAEPTSLQVEPLR